ncbi:MAG: 4Fe-4S binding protein [Bacteroidales bacterium]|nr:4Fe-4S binding protein [Candidatus Equibacterium intestinale]
MSKQSIVGRNWPKYLLQWGVLAALVLFITGIIKTATPADPETYCPMGGLEAFSTYLVLGSLPCSMNTLQIVMGLALAAAVILFSKLFCGYICPIGTVEDLLAKLRKALKVKAVKVKSPVLDKVLRIVKYAILFWIVYMTASSSELFCKNLDPYYAVATGFKGEITLWMSIITVSLVLLCGFFINSFWCKYVCPLGAASNTFKFWVWLVVLFAAWFVMGRLGLHMPWWVLLAAFCLLGYLLEILCGKPRMQVMHVYRDAEKCNSCGLCTKRCPMNVNIAKFDGAVNCVDCTLCGDCVAACNQDALAMGLTKKAKGGFWKFAPAILAVALAVAAYFVGNSYELPTINEKWNMDQVDESALTTMTVENLKTVKCYGSSMAFKAKAEKIKGVYGVKTFVRSHKVVLTYDPSATTEDAIREKIFTPSKFRIESPSPAETDSVKVVTIRTEGMFDKMDLNYLGLQMRNFDKKIYGLESEFACPLIVRVFMDPTSDADKDWFKEVVNMPQLELGKKMIDLNSEFVKMEDEVSYVSISDYLHSMFSPFKAEFKSRVEAAQGKEQFVYQIVDQNYEKPIVSRNFPFVSNHLSRNEGIISVIVDLNDNLEPSLNVRYCEPMTAEKIWELLNMEKWTITYSEDDVREVDAKMKFNNEGVVLPYDEK